MRSLLSLALAGLVLAALPAAPRAEEADWPSRPIKVIVPNPPAGGADNLARPMAEWLGQALGQPLVIENRGGASGAIGLEALARSPKDGYTMMVAVNAPFVVLPHLRKMPIDPLKELTPVAMLTDVASGVAIHPSVPAKNFHDLVVYSRANPGAIHYASAGVGSITHLRNEMISRIGNLGWVHVPYRGNGEAIADVLAGNIELMGESSTFAFVRQGKMRLVAVMSNQRVAEFPDIPTVREEFPEFEAPTWYAMFAPAGTPRPIIDKMNRTVAEVLKRPEVRQRLATLGHQPMGTDSPEELAAKIERHSALYAKVIDDLGIRQE